MHADYRMTSTEWALLALLSLLWGGSFFFAKVAVQALPPLTVVLARVALAAVALGLYLRWRGAALPRGIFEAEDAREAGQIRAFLEQRGTPIGPLGILIAAQTRRCGSALVTLNHREFERVPQLIVTDWST